MKESNFIIELMLKINRYRQVIPFLIKNRFIIKYILRNYYRIVVKKKKQLRLIELTPGYECNYKCNQCSAAASIDENKKKLSLDEFKSVVDQAIELGAFQFNITGGEPLLFDITFPLIEYINSKNMYIHLVTNGSLLDEKKVKKLSNIGLNSIEMGLDSAEAPAHNANRGEEKSYDKIMENINLIKKYKMNIILNTIITHEKINNGDMQNLANLARKKNVILQITPPCVTGRWKGKKEILLNDKEIKFFRKLMTKKNVRTDIFSGFFGMYCTAGAEKLGITPYGDVIPCGLVQLFYGNIREKSLKTLWDNVLENEHYTARCPYGCLTSFDKIFIGKYL